MKLLSLSLGLLFSISTSMAWAVSLPPVTRQQPICYGREYSTAHMEKSSKQSIKRMDVKFFDEGDGKQEFYVETKPYSNTLICQTYQGKYWCGVECDGGSVHFEGSFGQSVKLVNNGVTVEGGCGEEIESIFIPQVPGGDDFFTLYSLPAQFCQR